MLRRCLEFMVFTSSAEISATPRKHPRGRELLIPSGDVCVRWFRRVKVLVDARRSLPIDYVAESPRILSEIPLQFALLI